MFKLQCARMRRAAGLGLAVFLAATLHAQTSTAGQSGSAADNALLAKARTMYYSTTKAGLSGFDCAVHPDWHAMFASADPGADVSNNDSRVTLLNGVAITLHARMKGGSTLDWTPAAGGATDADSTALLKGMHEATEQTLVQGFLEFWTPFMDGEVVPDNSSGLTVTHGPSTFTLHSVSNGTDVTEVFSNDLMLEKYDVIMGSTSIKFEPTYNTTAQGLLVERFLAHLQQLGNPPTPVQEIRVGIEYQTIEGFFIPRQLNLEVAGAWNFNMSLDGCTVSRR
jgi:hypothetical protein